MNLRKVTAIVYTIVTLCAYLIFCIHTLFDIKPSPLDLIWIGGCITFAIISVWSACDD